MPLLLTRRDVESVLTMKETIAAVEEGLKRLALGRAIMPQRTAIRMAGHHGLHLGMPAFIEGEGDDPGVLALKVVTVYPDNPGEALPAHDHRDHPAERPADGRSSRRHGRRVPHRHADRRRLRRRHQVPGARRRPQLRRLRRRRPGAHATSRGGRGAASSSGRSSATRRPRPGRGSPPTCRLVWGSR